MSHPHAYPPIDPLDWSTVQPHVEALLAVPLDAASVDPWLRQWSDLAAVLEEAGVQVYREVTENTADAAAEQRFEHFVREIEPQARVAEQALKEKLLAVSGYQPGDDAALLLRRFRNDAEIFRPENVALESQLALLANQYDKRIGAMTIEWQGREETLPQAMSRLEEPDRAAREAVWRRIMQRYLAERGALDELYMQMLPLRRQSAANAGFATYRDFRWQQLARFDYTPDDAFTFHDAIEYAVVPLATRLYRQLAGRLDVDSLRPWDTEADPHGQPLRPFADAAELEAGGQRIFEQVDPALARHFSAMRDGYLDLASRPHKAPGGYCNGFPVSGTPYIFMNAVGTNDDVMTLLHEGGHAFHFMESQRQPLIWNHHAQMEFCEVASMAMELLSAPYLARDKGGFYTEAEARRAYADQLRKMVLFLPYMAVVDRFQHWVYAEAPEGVTPADLDRTWSALWDRFLPGVDTSGLQVEKETGWHRKGHIFQAPFYYIEYGLAQMGALQVWRNALADQAGAVASYRCSLALGYTQSLPELFAAAGARFAFDRATVGELMALVGERLAALEG
jgi:oligoendopeptidase F